MEKIGYSLVSKSGNEISIWGDIAGQEQGIPNVVRWPNGDQTHCPEVGMERGGCKLVPRYLVIDGVTGESVAFDGQSVTVTRAA